jgi:hypothetical protein
LSGCAEIEPLLAAHVLGVLETPERDRVEAHLAICPQCQLAHRRLEALPALLDLAGGTEAPIGSPPPLLEASVLAALPPARSRPRWRRRPGLGLRGTGRVRPRLLGTAVGVGLAALAVLALLLGTGAPATSGLRVAMSPSGVQPVARAQAVLRPRPWGTEVDLRARLAPTRGRQVYELWFVAPGGRLSAGTFTVGPSGRATVTLAAGAHPGQYRSIGITLEPDGLIPARRGPNILYARLPE